MREPRGIAKTNSTDLIATCNAIAPELAMQWTIESSMANLLLRLQEEDFNVVLFDCEENPSCDLTWIAIMRNLRPKLPIVVVKNELDPDDGAKLHEKGVFYVCVEPVQASLLSEVVSSALKCTM